MIIIIFIIIIIIINIVILAVIITTIITIITIIIIISTTITTTTIIMTIITIILILILIFIPILIRILTRFIVMSVLLYDADQKEPEGSLPGLRDPEPALSQKPSNEEEVKFILETRPISARPFKLENARPWDDKGSLALIMRAARFGRRMSQQSHRQVGVPLVHSNSKKDGSFGV
eukprot:s4830_g2.t1